MAGTNPLFPERQDMASHPDAREKQTEAPDGGSDGAFVEGLTREDLDGQSIERYLGRVAAAGRREIPAGRDPWESLLATGLVRDEKHVTRAACLLFAKEPQRYIPAATVQCVAYGYDAIVVRERQTVSGTVLDHVGRALAFIERNRLGNVVQKRGKNEPVWAFPGEAVAEILANAVCHRDYGVGRAIQVSLFDEFLQVGSPGGLPEGLTLKQVSGQEGARKCRNPLLARAFADMGLARGDGGGLARAFRACQENGSPAPVLADAPDFTAKLPARPDATLPATKIIAQIGPVARSMLVGKMATRVYEKLLETPGLNAPRLGEALGVSIMSVSMACKALKEHRFIEHRGAKTGGGYYPI